MKWILSGAFVLLAALSKHVVAQGNELRFSYWNDATPPFVIEENGNVKSGILKDLADRISAKLDLPKTFIKLPVPRIEPQLKSGEIDLDCLTSPIWKESPDAYNWSPALFDAADRFLVKPELAAKLHSFDSLKGLTLGIYHGYVYHPEIMRLIEAGLVETIKLKGLEHGIRLMRLGRLDTFIDFGLLLKYQLRESQLQGELTLAALPADEYKLYCAYSKKTKTPANELNQIIQTLVETGVVERILKRYQ